uniref:Uncharacterized protein n=1 Tax=Cacopsylla melanoneura TaxID=428564 RepID=A0A8D9E476_9HEMI
MIALLASSSSSRCFSFSSIMLTLSCSAISSSSIRSFFSCISSISCSSSSKFFSVICSVFIVFCSIFSLDFLCFVFLLSCSVRLFPRIFSSFELFSFLDSSFIPGAIFSSIVLPLWLVLLFSPIFPFSVSFPILSLPQAFSLSCLVILSLNCA